MKILYSTLDTYVKNHVKDDTQIHFDYDSYINFSLYTKGLFFRLVGDNLLLPIKNQLYENLNDLCNEKGS